MRKKCCGRLKKHLDMVQTSAGTVNSEWIRFIRECSALYHARKAAEAGEKRDGEVKKQGKCAKAKKAPVETPLETQKAVMP